MLISWRKVLMDTAGEDCAVREKCAPAVALALLLRRVTYIYVYTYTIRKSLQLRLTHCPDVAVSGKCEMSFVVLFALAICFGLKHISNGCCCCCCCCHFIKFYTWLWMISGGIAEETTIMKVHCCFRVVLHARARDVLIWNFNRKFEGPWMREEIYSWVAF